MIKYNLKKKLFSDLASIFLISMEEEKRIIEKNEELVEWIPVEKLDRSEKLICPTCPYEDIFKIINNDIEEMKKIISEFYSLQNKKQDTKIDNLNAMQVDIQEDIKENKVVFKKEGIEKLVKIKKSKKSKKKKR